MGLAREIQFLTTLPFVDNFLSLIFATRKILRLVEGKTAVLQHW